MSKITNIERAAQCWCDEETSGIEMDSRLATAFAKRLDETDREISLREIDTLRKLLADYWQER